jgi:hypothetical protein
VDWSGRLTSAGWEDERAALRGDRLPRPKRGYRWTRADGNLPGWTSGIAWHEVRDTTGGLTDHREKDKGGQR